MRSASWSFPRDLSLDLAETIDTVVGNGGDVSKIRLNAARAEEERAAQAGLVFLVSVPQGDNGCTGVKGKMKEIICVLVMCWYYGEPAL